MGVSQMGHVSFLSSLRMRDTHRLSIRAVGRLRI